jgi:hypothetical protein
MNIGISAFCWLFFVRLIMHGMKNKKIYRYFTIPYFVLFYESNVDILKKVRCYTIEWMILG